jgi:amidase
VQPNAPTLDAVGPIARSVTDVAVALGLMQDIDRPSDQLRAVDGAYPADMAAALRSDALKGVRVGFPRSAFSGDDPQIDAAMNTAILDLQAAGATVVEIDLPSWLIPLSSELQSILVRTESAPSLDAYLAGTFPARFPQSHAQLLALSERITSSPPAGATANPGRLDGYRGEAAARPLTDPEYIAARDEGRDFLRASLEAVLARNRLDVIVYPTQTTRINRLGENAQRNARGLFGNFGPVLASLSGWPELTVPAGMTEDGLPVGVSFLGPAFSEQRLLGYGFAFEQQAHGLRQPKTTPPLAGDRFAF